jgi:hypothetical protein
MSTQWREHLQHERPDLWTKHANSIKTEFRLVSKYSAIIEMNDAGVQTAKCVSAF